MKAIDVSKHRLVPKHILLNEKEKEEVLKKYGNDLKKFPRILQDDPAIASLNAKPGDIIKIIRECPYTGKNIYYRVVVRG